MLNRQKINARSALAGKLYYIARRDKCIAGAGVAQVICLRPPRRVFDRRFSRGIIYPNIRDYREQGHRLALKESLAVALDHPTNIDPVTMEFAHRDREPRITINSYPSRTEFLDLANRHSIDIHILSR